MKKLLSLLVLSLVLSSFGLEANAQKNNSLSLKATNATIYSGNKVQIKASSKSMIVYSTENEFNATVSSSGMVTAGKVGETNIILTSGKDTKKFKVIVKPKSNLYEVPNVEWGISRNALIKKLGAPSAETATGIVYQTDSEAVPTLVYLFDENNELKNTGVIVSVAYRSKLDTFLNERYFLMRSDDDGVFYANEMAIEAISMGIGVTPYGDDFVMINYYPFTVDPASLTLD